MNALDRLIFKRTLEVLDPLSGGIAEKPLFDYVEMQVARTLTDLDRARALRMLVDHGWITSSRHAFTDDIIYAITSAGRMAMIGL